MRETYAPLAMGIDCTEHVRQFAILIGFVLQTGAYLTHNYKLFCGGSTRI